MYIDWLPDRSLKVLPVENKIVPSNKNTQKKCNNNNHSISINVSKFSVLNGLEWHHAAMK